MNAFTKDKTKVTARLRIVLCFLVALSCILLSSCEGCDGCGCSDETSDTVIYYGGDYQDAFQIYDCFSVNYLDVGDGDAIFINFNDGNTLLIDCGEKNERNYKTIARYLDAYAKDKNNYLILTHVDSDHVGNAEDIITNYPVKKAFIPDILQPEKFNLYYSAYKKLQEKANSDETEISYSETGKRIIGEDYYLVMLSPNACGTTDSAYDKINSYEDPPADARNDISPIIYLDYKGVKFVFTGDAGFSQEKVALNNVSLGFIDRYLKASEKGPIGFYDIDFLKVSHHGANDASGDEFLQTLTPKNAVISVSGINTYGHPTKQTLERIIASDYECKFYLTSVEGTVSVLVDGEGNATVKTAKTAA